MWFSGANNAYETYSACPFYDHYILNGSSILRSSNKFCFFNSGEICAILTQVVLKMQQICFESEISKNLTRMEKSGKEHPQSAFHSYYACQGKLILYKTLKTKELRGAEVVHNFHFGLFT